MRCLDNVSAQGRMSPGFRPEVIFPAYPSSLARQSPERSGLPSAVFGAGAVRFGLPSALRGIPGVGYFSHWAAAGPPKNQHITIAAMAGDLFMRTSLLNATIRQRAPRSPFSLSLGSGCCEQL